MVGARPRSCISSINRCLSGVIVVPSDWILVTEITTSSLQAKARASHQLRGTKLCPLGRYIREAFSCVLGMLSSLGVKVPRPT